MPYFPWPGRRDASAEDAALAALLSGSGGPEDLSASLRPAADLLAALRAGPSGDELAGESAAMAEFRDRVGVSEPTLPARRRRPSVLSSLLSAKAAAAALAVAVVFGGVASAAYAGVLPSSAQRVAHEFIGAPAAHDSTASATTAAAKAVRHHRRRHHARHGCFVPRPHRLASPSSSPSMSSSPSRSASPTPKPSPSCPPPIRHRHPVKHHKLPSKAVKHHKVKHHKVKHHKVKHHRSPHPMPSPSPSSSAPSTT
jgi:hypothetical protein